MARPVPIAANPTVSADDEPRPVGPCHPAGPLVAFVRSPSPAATRSAALAVLAGCVVLIGLSLWLRPDPSGDGTHQQLGLPPCSSIVVFGYPCPTCGMTTAFAHTMRGQLMSAFAAQPAGMLMALGVVASAIVSLAVAWTGKRFAVNWCRVPPGRLLILAIVLILAGWGYKLLVGMATGQYPAGP